MNPKVLQKRTLRVLNRAEHARKCGTCTACCTSQGVEELGKPPDTACQHLGGKGCTVYDNRPAGCQEFLCMWRLGLVPGEFRPDRLGVVLSIEKEPELMGDGVYVAAREVVSGGFANADDLLAQIALKQVVLLLRGTEAVKVLGGHATAKAVRQRLGLS